MKFVAYEDIDVANLILRHFIHAPSLKAVQQPSSQVYEVCDTGADIVDSPLHMKMTSEIARLSVSEEQ